MKGRNEGLMNSALLGRRMVEAALHRVSGLTVQGK